MRLLIGNPIPVCSAPEGIAFDPANGNLYVACARTNAVSVISGQTNQVIGKPIPVGRGATGITFDSSNGNLYVSNDFDATVSVISGQTNTVIGSPIHVGVGPYLIAFDSSNGNLYVVNNNDHTVSVISGQTNMVIGNPIPVGVNPFGIAFDSANDNLYVTNSNPGTVSAISGQTNTVVGNPIPVGGGAFGIAFDSANGNLYVANQASNTVSVISTTIPPMPPDTTITSAVDGAGARIPNGGTTVSTSIQIAFSATAGTNPVAGFECRLDGSAFSACSSLTTLNNLAAGMQHNFQVRAVDTVGNRDLTPASFSWTIATITPPTHTTITSAVDGNGAIIQNGGTTTSSSIKIAFTATQGSNPIAGFQCSLDNSPLSNCISPASFNNLAAGPHKFAVVPVDTAGSRDPNPATFGWIVGTVTPTQSIQQLIQLKHSMNLDPATDRLLDSQLNAALQFVQHNFNSGACGHINGFVIQVQAALQVGHITQTQAAQLIQSTQAIRTALHC